MHEGGIFIGCVFSYGQVTGVFSAETEHIQKTKQ